MELINREKTISTVRYHVFVHNEHVDDGKKEKLLSRTCDECLAYVAGLMENYIWHWEKFDLRFSPASPEYTNCLYGSVDFRGNMDDEWFVVYLLLRLSSWKKELFIKITDDDGQFLLAEAAHALPDWAEPDTCENRLVLTRGKFYLLPLDVLQGNPSFLNVVKKLMCMTTMQTLDCISEIDAVIQARLSQVKKMPILQKHHTICYMPVAASKFLETHKEIIPLAIDAYYHRNEDNIELCTNSQLLFFSEANNPSYGMNYSELNASGERSALIPSLVCMTRIRYAQLLSDACVKPKCLLPHMSSIKKGSCKNLNRRVSTGIKLTCGLEILARSYGIGDWGYRFHKFVLSLKKKQYFENVLEGSEEYNKRFRAAKSFFEQKEGAQTKELGIDSQLNVESAGYIVFNYLQKQIENPRCSTFDDNKTTKMPHIPENDLKILETQEDDDSWLNIDYDKFSQLAGEKFGFKGSAGQNGPVGDTTDTLNNLSATFRDFLKKESSFDGVENEATVGLNAEAFMEALKSFGGGNDRDFKICSDRHKDGTDDDESDGCGISDADVINQLMDEELSGSTMSETFDRVPSNNKGCVKKKKNGDFGVNSSGNEYGLDALDLDYNLVSNILKGFEAERSGLSGGAGPVSVMLQNLEEASDAQSWVPPKVGE